MSSIFGSIPNYNQVQSPYQQIHQRVPGLPTMTGTAASNIQDELSGNLPSDVTGQIRNAGAAWGISSGMPGSGAAGDVTLKDLGISSLQMQQQGMGNYMNFLSGIGGMMMPVDEQMTAANAAAAPDPTLAGVMDIGGTLLGGLFGGGGSGGGSGGGGSGGGSGGSGSGGGGGPSITDAPASMYSNSGTSSFGPSSYGSDGTELSDYLYGAGGNTGFLTSPLYGAQQEDNYF